MNNNASVSGPAAGNGFRRALPTPSAYLGTGQKWHRIANAMRRSDRVVEAGFVAELVFRRLIEASNERLSDGVLSVAVALRESADAPGGAQAALDTLVTVGLIGVDGGILTIRNFGGRQNTQAELAGSAAANAERSKAVRAAAKADAVPTVDDVPALTLAPEVTLKAGQVGFDPQADKACEYLATAVAAVTGGDKPTVSNAWRKDMHGVLGTDKRDPALVRKVIDAALADEKFWRNVMHSPVMLRSKWTQLVMLTRPKKGAAAKGGALPEDDLDTLTNYTTSTTATTLTAVA